MKNNFIRPAKPADAAAICEIYNYYITETSITFEENPVSTEEMSQRILDVSKDLVWLVYEEDAKILGYSYYTKWKIRSAYRFCFESTVYVDKSSVGKGIGSQLYSELLVRAGKQNVHSLLGGITIPNEPSIKLHEKLGFVKVGQLREVGLKFDRWIDVGYWEIIF